MFRKLKDNWPPVIFGTVCFMLMIWVISQGIVWKSDRAAQASSGEATIIVTVYSGGVLVKTYTTDKVSGSNGQHKFVSKETGGTVITPRATTVIEY